MSNMSRSEAIKQLRLLKGDIKFGIASKVENKNQIEALSIAIASLETDEAYQLEYEQPEFCADCISRKNILECLNGAFASTDWNKALFRKIVMDSPSVLPKTTKNDLGVELIDRVELLKAMDTWDKFGYTETGCFVREPKGDYVPYVHYEDVVNCVKGMSSVTPIRPKGHWIGHREHCENLGVIPSGLGAYEWCSNCDCGIDVREWHRNHYNFCPNCGSDMREVEE